jgi:hypothetical protein
MPSVVMANVMAPKIRRSPLNFSWQIVTWRNDFWPIVAAPSWTGSTEKNGFWTAAATMHQKSVYFTFCGVSKAANPSSSEYWLHSTVAAKKNALRKKGSSIDI